MRRAKARPVRGDKAGTRTVMTVEDARRLVLPLSAEEVCAIIERCNRANVSSFSYAGLSVTFGKVLDDSSEGTAFAGAVPPRPGNTMPSDGELSQARARLADLRIQEDEAAVIESIETREFQLEQLKVTDPERFEAIMNGSDEVP